ncbi:hypothetical protein MTR67_023251 [Solanum verrucosum]|uniref:Uncharacterized protein n=1 Tax=Solanum verrucosum TaxID=315347 RepID=A0AAF0QUV4_SOLVR|nr:hypothetical protein MTR67_023251 [Solanum verrucosum]
MTARSPIRRSLRHQLSQGKLESREEKTVKNPSSRTQQGSISSSPKIERFLRGIRDQVCGMFLSPIRSLEFSRILDSMIMNRPRVSRISADHHELVI